MPPVHTRHHGAENTVDRIADHAVMPAARRAILRPKRMALDLLLGLLLCGLLLAFCMQAAQTVQHTWKWDAFFDYLILISPEGEWSAGLLGRGLLTTIRLSVWALFFSLLLGVCLGIFTARRRGLCLFITQIYINLMRNTPPLVLLFLVFFLLGDLILPLSALDDVVRALPPAGREWCALLFAPVGQAGRMAAAVLTLALYEGAYIAEIVRGGLESVPRTQWDAASALGFSRAQSLRLVIAPQSMPLILPPLAGQVVSIVKDSALASLISISELTFQGMEVMATSRLTFEVWLTVAILYLGLALCCTRSLALLERRFSRHTKVS